MSAIDPKSSEILLLSGTGNRPLAESIARELGGVLCDVTVEPFADGEIFVRINENVRGRDTFIVQPTGPPAENIIELLLLIDAAKRASAARVTAVVPYFGYARQDRKDQPRVAIGAKLMANMITHAGADRLVSVDFHQHQVQAFFDIPVDHLYALPVFVEHYKERDLDPLVVVASDVGAAKMARGYARRLGGEIAMIDKRRPAPNVAEVVNVVGDVQGKNCLIPDDMIDTGGTIAEAVKALKTQGAAKVYVNATHGLLSGSAVSTLAEAPLDEIAVTDTIYLPEQKQWPALRILSVAPLLASAIRNIHDNTSVSILFE
ncbi:MAG: ribose-phosphate pyrophosphokinase [Gemmatimonadota bacterium]|nr:ribose-phosphate pyrophosphokinase [Candidatus Palauibacterales bacterium]